jgi:hypothetical protein
VTAQTPRGHRNARKEDIMPRSVTRAARRPPRSLPAAADAPAPPHLRSLRLRLADGAWTTLHVVGGFFVRATAPRSVSCARAASHVRACVAGDPEGFPAGAGQLHSDITAGRYPRAALALCRGGRLLAVALNLDGGGSTSLVCAGRLRNRPLEAHGIELPGGRPVTTRLAFTARQRLR